MIHCLSQRTFAEKSPGPWHPGAGMVTVHLQVSRVLQEKNKSGLCFSTTQNKIKIIKRKAFKYRITRDTARSLLPDIYFFRNESLFGRKQWKFFLCLSIFCFFLGKIHLLLQITNAIIVSLCTRFPIRTIL